MRLFIAALVNDPVKAALLDLQRQMREQRVGGSYIAPENLHLTLTFIGEYPDPDRVLETMGQIPFRPFRLELSGVGCFGDLWWVGIRGPAAPEGYVRRLRRGLAAADIPFDRKGFFPHFTLVRRADRAPAGLTVPAAGMEVTRVSLMRSDRGKNGMIYTEVGGIE